MCGSTFQLERGSHASRVSAAHLHRPYPELSPPPSPQGQQASGVVHSYVVFPLQGCGPGSSSERTRTAITAALSKKLKDLMGDFQNLRARLQQEYRWAALICAALRGGGRVSSMFWTSSRDPQVRKAARPSCDRWGLTHGHCAAPYLMIWGTWNCRRTKSYPPVGHVCNRSMGWWTLQGCALPPGS